MRGSFDYAVVRPYLIDYAKHMSRKSYPEWLRLYFSLLESYGEVEADEVFSFVGEEKPREYERLKKSFKRGRGKRVTAGTFFYSMKAEAPEIYSAMLAELRRARDGASYENESEPRQELSKPKERTLTKQERLLKARQRYAEQTQEEAEQELATLPQQYAAGGEELYPVTCNDVITNKTFPSLGNGDNAHKYFFSQWLPLELSDGDGIHKAIISRIEAGAAHCFAVFVDENGEIVTEAHTTKLGRFTPRRAELAAYARLYAVDVDESELTIEEHVERSVAGGADASRLVFGYYSFSDDAKAGKRRFRLVFDAGETIDLLDDYSRQQYERMIAKGIADFGGDVAASDVSRLWFGNSKAKGASVDLRKFAA